MHERTHGVTGLGYAMVVAVLIVAVVGVNVWLWGRPLEPFARDRSAERPSPERSCHAWIGASREWVAVAVDSEALWVSCEATAESYRASRSEVEAVVHFPGLGRRGIAFKGSDGWSRIVLWPLSNELLRLLAAYGYPVRG